MCARCNLLKQVHTVLTAPIYMSEVAQCLNQIHTEMRAFGGMDEEIKKLEEIQAEIQPYLIQPPFMVLR